MPQNNTPSLEVCVDDVAGLQACEGRVDRVELCSALSVGGLTPSAGLIAAAQHSNVPIHAMIRPRVGGFDYTSCELDVALSDIGAVRDAGLAGVVLGATKDGQLDLESLHRMKDAAGDLDCTLHRAIDLLPDPISAMEQVIDLGFVRILTSGGAPRAMDGLDRLAAMITVAAERIEIMVGSGVAPNNVAEIGAKTGCRSFHSSCSRPAPTPPSGVEFGFAPEGMRVTSIEEIEAMRRALSDI